MKAFRIVAMAFKDLVEGEGGEKHNDPENDLVKDVEKQGLTLIAMAAFHDPVSPEVPSAIARFK